MSHAVLDAYFDNLEAVKQSFFPDLFFRNMDSGCPLAVAMSSTCRFLRLRLPPGQSLQLERIQVQAVLDNGGTVNIAADAEITVSSILSGTAHLLEKRCLVNPAYKGLGIHTDNNRQGEWVCLDFGKTFALQQVVVSNTFNVWSWRAWQLIIETSSDGEVWSIQYDHAARLLSYIECISKYGIHIPPDSPPNNSLLLSSKALAACHAIAPKMIARQYGQARELLAKVLKTGDVTKDEAARIRAGFSKLVLKNEQLSWSGHGILRPFAFWSDAEKRKYLEQAVSVVKALQSVSPSVCFGFGMVLGYVRDGDLVPHDDDVDIIISFDRSVARTLPDALRLVSETLQAEGFVVTGDHLFSHRWVKVPGGRNFDVFVGLHDNEYVSWYPSARNGFLSKDIFPPLEVNFHGVECPLPKSPVHYLEVTYGKQWRLPDPDFHHPWDMTSYTDLNK